MKIVHTVHNKRSKEEKQSKSLKKNSEIQIQIKITEYTASQSIKVHKTRNRKQQDLRAGAVASY